MRVQQAIDNSLLKPFIWWRFIDEIFIIWTHWEEHLKTFIGYLISIHPSIKFTHEYSNSLHQTLPFLNVQVHLINNHIQTDLHTKPTGKHQYLLKISCHPNHTKKPSHSASSFESAAYVLPTLFWPKKPRTHRVPYERCYSRTLLERDANRVRSIPHYETLQPQEQKSAKTIRTPFLTSFKPALAKISSVVNKYTTLLQATANYKKAFPNPPVIAESRDPGLRDLLVHSTLALEIPPANDPQELKDATTHPASLVHFYERVKQTIIFLKLTKKEKSPTPSPYLRTQKSHIPDRMLKVPPSILQRDQASTQWMLWVTKTFYPESATTQHNYTSITTL